MDSQIKVFGAILIVIVLIIAIFYLRSFESDVDTSDELDDIPDTVDNT